MVHDLLAFLAEQMLEMNKQKQQEIKGFLGWLEGEVVVKVDDLTSKTKVQEYYKLQFDELRHPQEEQTQDCYRSGQTRATGEAAGRVCRICG